LKIRKILISQPVPAVLEKSPYYEIYNKYDTQIDYHPFIKVEGVSLKEYRSQRVEIMEHTAVILTSRALVDHFFRICEGSRISETDREKLKYICNTEAVALYLQKYIQYRKRRIFFADGTFANFMDLILKHKEEKFLLGLSEPHNPEIPRTLEKLKIKFDRLILSRAVSEDLSDIKLADYDVITLFSPSDVSALVAAFGTDNMPHIVAFGEGTVRAAAEAGLTVNAMAPTPEAPSMAKALDIFISHINKGEEVPAVKLADDKKAAEFIKAREKSIRKSRPRKSATAAAKKPASSAASKPAAK
jgi:uroporphyrinogen-III synthase